MSTLDRVMARLLGRWLREPLRQVLAEQDPRQAGPEAHVEMYKYLVHGDRSKLDIHPTAVVNNALFNVGSGTITVGEYAFFGHNVSVLTGTHDINTFGRERQLAVPRSGRDIVIGEGAWVASNAMVLGPCRIGATRGGRRGLAGDGRRRALHDRRRVTGQGPADHPPRRPARLTGQRGCCGPRRAA